MKTLLRLAAAGIVAFILLQLVRPGIPTRPAEAEIAAPPEIRQILQKDCYSCHSDERRLAWFDQVVPAYWLVRHDILTAREHLNFSTIGSKPAAAQRATLFEGVNMIQLGAMPLPQFTALHPDAKVTPEELATLKAYLAPWGSLPATAVTPPIASLISAASILPEPDGFPFDPSFVNWKLISTTDRGDNQTFRFILGNEIAWKAVQSGNISPWPDGARLAKIAWQQELGPDGLIHPGKFIQVELMLKDAANYKKTEGWGWGRWRGLDLKPYGSDAAFVNECTSCHLPVHGNDYVYTLPITAAKANRDDVVNNNAAALPATLPYQPLGWNAITMNVDPKNRTAATLFGNDQAFQGVHATVQSAGVPVYAPGSVLALVTWAQRDDPHWFGARIPNLPLSVEFIQVGPEGKVTQYRRFAGPSLAENQPTPSDAATRSRFLLDLPPAQLPRLVQ
jgi:mono/diheme cytochrome c family protein